jgi:enterochelin esterase family protein
MNPSDYGTALNLAGDLYLPMLDAPSLRDNPLGDPSKRLFPIYTPPGYDPQGSRRYPVLYCLHGYTGSAAVLIAAQPWNLNVIQRADRLIREKKMPEAIVAIVDGWTRFGGSQYVNSIHNGNYASLVVEDAIPFVDANFRTIAHEGGRAVFGKSSGGFGSFHMVFEYPGTFAAFASHSGDAYFSMCYMPEFAAAVRTFEKFGSPKAFLETFERTNKPPQDFFAAVNELGMTAAYSPAKAEAFALDFPFDLKTAELREDIFAKWLTFDPVERVGPEKAKLERLRLLYVDCGIRDEYNLAAGARIFAQRCRDAGIDVRHEEFDDDHRNVGYRYDVSLPALAEALDRAN